jgi:phosphomevalonate kinase
MIASAPGKLILTGEYAVLDGAPALVIAVDRRASARRRVGLRGTSPFLVAVAEEIAQRRGADDPAARAALEIGCDSTQFFDGPLKLGLGSSAAVTVAATALALGTTDHDEVFSIASAAHARAQAPLGTRGSSADVAASVHGGVIEFERGTVQRLRWPLGLTMVAFFTGVSAETPKLVAAVAAARTANPASVDAALAAVRTASQAACKACATHAPELAATGLMAAIALAASATDQLAAATGIPLVPSCVVAARRALARLGGAAKTTGAGGGDIAIAVIPRTEDVTVARRLLIEAGCRPLELSVDHTGVDLRLDAQ